MTGDATLVSSDEFCILFLSHIRRVYKYQKIAADFYDVSEAYLSAVIRGVKPPNKNMLTDIGFDKIVVKKIIYKKRSA